MDWEFLTEWAGDGGAAAVGGLLIGLLYGASAQRSRFCLRAAAVEFARGAIGPRSSIWLLCFATAIFWVQTGVATGMLDLGEARWLSSAGTISGALLGGLTFGAGMVLARGCPGRLLVLAATGNLRALLSGLVFAVTAQMSLYGLLGPVRSEISGWWVTAGPNPDLLAVTGLGTYGGVALAIAATMIALYFAIRNRITGFELLAGCGVGFAVFLGWAFTYTLSSQTFDPTSVESLTFSGPSADVLMFTLTPFDGAWDFDIGLVPGVLIGAVISALIFGEWRWQGFEGAANMRRYLIGAALMGFGAMLAGGCAIGAGVTGGSTFALTAWIALCAFWAGAAATDYLIDRPSPAPRGLAATPAE
ncbi:MAG: YeeE/YedE family protein [Pseudomonadota bacterium]